MAQMDVFKRERQLAKRTQQAAASQPQQYQQPPASPAEPAQPGMFDRMSSYFADTLRPQQGTIDTRPPQAGVPLKKKNPNVSSLRFKSPIYG